MYNTHLFCTPNSFFCTILSCFVQPLISFVQFSWLFVHISKSPICHDFTRPGPHISRLLLQYPTSHNRYYVNLIMVFSGSLRVRGGSKLPIKSCISVLNSYIGSIFCPVLPSSISVRGSITPNIGLKCLIVQLRVFLYDSSGWLYN